MFSKRIASKVLMIIMGICLLTTTVYAATGEQLLKVIFNNQKIYVDGVQLQAKDTQGSSIEPFSYNGVNYYSVNALATAFGKTVTTDNKTNSILITSNANSQTVNYTLPVDVHNPKIKLDMIKVVYSSIDAFRLEYNGIKTNITLSNEDNSLKLQTDSWLNRYSNYTLKLFLNDGSRKIINFQTGGLPKLELTNSRQIIFVPAMPESGFNYPYYLVLPNKINVEKNKGNKNYLFVETHNTGKASDDLNFHIREALTIAQGNSATIADTLGLPRIVPILVRPKSTINNQYIYTHDLTRNTMILQEIKKTAGTYDDVFITMDRVDLQVENMIKHANTYLGQNGWKMENKIFMWGFSASGDFTNRFTFLHPELVKAACFGGFPTIPVNQVNGYNMIYPLGTYDYKSITGKNFDLAAYNNVAKLGYMGSVDYNNPTLMDDMWTAEEKVIINKVLAVKEYPDRWNKMLTLFEKSGAQAQANIYIGAAHETFYKGMTQDYMNFFMANRQSTKPVYVRPSDPKTTLTNIYSKDIVEVTVQPFSYDKTTIIDAFWSGSVPVSLPKNFVDFLVTVPDFKYSANTLLISIAEWDSTKDYSQMEERLKKAGRIVVLKATGYRDVTIEMNGGSITSGQGDAQLYWATVKNPNDMVSDVRYKVTASSGYWTISEDVYVVRPKN